MYDGFQSGSETIFLNSGNRMEKNSMKNIAQSKYYGLFVLLIAGFGIFLTALDLLIANVALPNIQEYFNIGTNTVAWIITIYTLSLSATIIFFGRLSDRYGHLNLFRIGIIVFGIASLCSGFSKDISTLIFFRAVQGLGAAMIQATASALITTLLPKESHGKAMAGFVSFFGIGNIMGASLGGIIVSFLHWGWIFWINIPFCIAIFIASFKLKQKIVTTTKSLDLKGIIIYTIAASLLILGIESFANVENISKSFAYIFISVIFIMYLFIVEKKQEFPAINVNIFFSKKIFPLSLGILASGYLVATVYVTSPIILYYLFNESEWKIGIISLIAPTFFILSTHFMKRLIHKISDKFFQITGFVIMGIAVFGLLIATDTKSLILYFIFLSVFGIGNGLFIPSNFHAYLKQVNSEWQGSASALARMLNGLGMCLGASISTAIIQLFQTYHRNVLQGYLTIWILGICITIGTSILFLFYKSDFNIMNKNDENITIVID